MLHWTYIIALAVEENKCNSHDKNDNGNNGNNESFKKYDQIQNKNQIKLRNNSIKNILTNLFKFY